MMQILNDFFDGEVSKWAVVCFHKACEIKFLAFSKKNLFI